MKLRCSNCLNNEDYITSYGHYHYCNAKEIWIPERKYERRRKCGKFKPLPWGSKEMNHRRVERAPTPVTDYMNIYHPEQTKPAGLKIKKLRWVDWEYWRGFWFLPGFLGKKLRQITKYLMFYMS